MPQEHGICRQTVWRWVTRWQEKGELMAKPIDKWAAKLTNRREEHLIPVPARVNPKMSPPLSLFPPQHFTALHEGRVFSSVSVVNSSVHYSQRGSTGISITVQAYTYVWFWITMKPVLIIIPTTTSTNIPSQQQSSPPPPLSDEPTPIIPQNIPTKHSSIKPSTNPLPLPHRPPGPLSLLVSQRHNQAAK